MTPEGLVMMTGDVYNLQFIRTTVISNLDGYFVNVNMRLTKKR